MASDNVGAIQIEVPRDRNGTFEPQLIKKRIDAIVINVRMVSLTDLKNRGVKDVFFIVCDGLKGLPDSDAEIRRIICTTNAIESINARYRRSPGEGTSPTRLPHSNACTW